VASQIRLLGPGDEPALEEFLLAHPDTTLFLRSNLQLAGIVHTGAAYSADYAAAFEAGAVVGVASHSWGGNLVVEAGHELGDLVRAVLEFSRRPLSGIVGCRDQVVEARRALGLDRAETTLDSCEDLFALELSELQVPAALASGAVRCRGPRADELDLLAQWRVAYEMEALGARDGPELRRACREAIDLYQRDERHWLLEKAGRPVAYSAFNAQLPDCVQIGGVYTPPAFRSAGCARSVVAGSLLFARQRGVRRSLLFTANENHAAQRAYRALGYRQVGDYGIVHFAAPQRMI